jgi:hypothetical protein
MLQQLETIRRDRTELRERLGWIFVGRKPGKLGLASFVTDNARRSGRGDHQKFERACDVAVAHMSDAILQSRRQCRRLHRDRTSL